MAGLSRWPKTVAAVVALAGIVLLTYALLAPQHSDQTTEHMGMWGTHSSYNSSQVALMLIAAIIIVTALIFIFARDKYEPIPLYPQYPQVELRTDTQVLPMPPTKETAEVEAVPASRGEHEGRHDFLVLRLLTGDERTMFKAIMDSGGEALQKDLILRTRMSNAKVSRLLDRLQQKDVISKERYGATNMIKISRKD